MKSSSKTLLGGALLLVSFQAAAQIAPDPTTPTADTSATSAADARAPAAPGTTPPSTTPAAEPGLAQQEAELAVREQEESLRDARADKERDALNGLGIAARVSTLGLGVEAIKSLHKRVNVRVQGNFFDYDQSVDEDGIRYDGKLKLQTLGALLDVYPFAGVPAIGRLRFSAGAYSNGNEIDLKANCRSQCEVGDVTVSSANSSQNPQLTGAADFDSFAPYLGLGFGNAMRGLPFHFAFDVGVLFQGAPKINLGASGIATVRDNNTGATTTRNLATDPDFQSQLRKESRNAEDDAKEFKYYPVVSLTIGYRFNLF